MTFDKLPSALDLLRLEISKKRGLADQSELDNLEHRHAALEDDAIRMAGLLDIDDEALYGEDDDEGDVDTVTPP